MAIPTGILFCENPFEKYNADPDFEDEHAAALAAGFSIYFINYEDLISEDRKENAVSKIKPAADPTLLIYRGWMLTPLQYAFLQASLLSRNFHLINSTGEYQNCHYLPDSLKFISAYTPQTVFEPLEDEQSIHHLLEKTKNIGSNKAIVKDYVKSEKHHWDTACFINDLSKTAEVRQIIENFIALRGQYLNKGIVVREFIELKPLSIHSKSGMPLTEEYRLFFINKSLLGVYNYWEEGPYSAEMPETDFFCKLASTIESQFFCMDIARKKDGSLVIIELGDGQVAGLPERCNIDEFYSLLKKRVAVMNIM